MTAPGPIRVVVHYDFASSLCYVAHRVLGRMSDFLDESGLMLEWTPIDLSRLMGWRPGAPIDPQRLEDVRQIAASLDVPIRIPHRWQDSYDVHAAGLALHERDASSGSQLEPSWRERVFTAVYEQGGRCDEGGLVERITSAMRAALTREELDLGAVRLDSRTRDAARSGVSGVPTFMLGEFPFGGIQEEATMRSVLGRYADKQRRPA